MKIALLRRQTTRLHTRSRPARRLGRDATTSATKIDVIVIGGGHAGCEAAAGAARAGARTVLITQRLDTIGEMSCNPSIGGVGKGHLLREVDALDGLIARVADEAAIHFRLLNRSKGPAVRGPRVQADRMRYKLMMQAALRHIPNLRLIEAAVEDLIILPCGAVGGVVAGCGEQLRAPAVVLTTGTFLRGLVLLGQTRTPAGRFASLHPTVSGGGLDLLELPSTAVSRTLERLGLPLTRMKTGTPPRLEACSIDWSHAALELQPSEDPPTYLSFVNALRAAPDAATLVCPRRGNFFLTGALVSPPIWSIIPPAALNPPPPPDLLPRGATNARTHQLVREHVHLLPDYKGAGRHGVGPRYCPSIIAKVTPNNTPPRLAKILVGWALYVQDETAVFCVFRPSNLLYHQMATSASLVTSYLLTSLPTFFSPRELLLHYPQPSGRALR